jgi:hypothetical protein
MKGFNIKHIILNALMSEFALDKYLDYTNRRLLYLARLQGQASELIARYIRTEKEPKNIGSTDEWSRKSGTGRKTAKLFDS